MNGGTPYDLNNVSSAGPDDVTWAYQWDVRLGAGDEFIFSKHLLLVSVPDPSSLVLAGLGLGLIGYRLRRSRKS